MKQINIFIIILIISNYLYGQNSFEVSIVNDVRFNKLSLKSYPDPVYINDFYPLQNTDKHKFLNVPSINKGIAINYHNRLTYKLSFLYSSYKTIIRYYFDTLQVQSCVVSYPIKSSTLIFNYIESSIGLSLKTLSQNKINFYLGTTFIVDYFISRKSTITDLSNHKIVLKNKTDNVYNFLPNNFLYSSNINIELKFLFKKVSFSIMPYIGFCLNTPNELIAHNRFYFFGIQTCLSYKFL